MRAFQMVPLHQVDARKQLYNSGSTVIFLQEPPKTTNEKSAATYSDSLLSSYAGGSPRFRAYRSSRVPDPRRLAAFLASKTDTMMMYSSHMTTATIAYAIFALLAGGNGLFEASLKPNPPLSIASVIKILPIHKCRRPNPVLPGFCVDCPAFQAASPLLNLL